MIEEYISPLRVESLKASHLSKLVVSKQYKHVASLRKLLFKSWIAKAENQLPTLFPARNSHCQVAIENEDIKALALIQPFNRRGSCWSIILPGLISEPGKYSLNSIRQELIESALQLKSNRIQSWIMRCHASDRDLISLAREFGFQPLKLFKVWSPKSTLRNAANDGLESLSVEIEWQKINQSNAPLLWSLVKVNESSHLRQILDRKWADLLYQNTFGSGVLIQKAGKNNTAIAGFVGRIGSEGQQVLELLKDLAWDTRLQTALPKVLNIISRTSKVSYIETASEDDYLTNFLLGIKWEQVGEEVILGRSLWKRKLNSKVIPGTKQLETMLGQLQPQRPPLPTPTLHPR